MSNALYSDSPVPSCITFPAWHARLEVLIAPQRVLGREIVVVTGVGFVGEIRVGVVADAMDRA